MQSRRLRQRDRLPDQAPSSPAMPRSISARVRSGNTTSPSSSSTREVVGTFTFLRRRRRVRRHPQQAQGPREPLLFDAREVVATAADRLGFRHAERAHVLLDGSQILAGGFPVVEQVFGLRGPNEVGTQFGPVESLRERVAHVGHHREVEQLGDVEFVVQPAGVRPVVLLHRTRYRPPPPRGVAVRRRGRGRHHLSGVFGLAGLRRRPRPSPRHDHPDHRDEHDQQFDQPDEEAHHPRMPACGRWHDRGGHPVWFGSLRCRRRSLPRCSPAHPRRSACPRACFEWPGAVREWVRLRQGSFRAAAHGAPNSRGRCRRLSAGLRRRATPTRVAVARRVGRR